ncbi:MAG: hypothetical protein ACRCYC_00195, partial [Paraclostridium sp.]|uniref:hypothetical protein n=1 Tax=Paraclostridium sp. TaxID=2023273 RepID=UPI003F412C53
MSAIIIELINVSLYISISILLIMVFKDKLLSKYTATFKYLVYIAICIRGIFIFKINITMPKFLESLVNTNDNILTFNNNALQNSLHINIVYIAFCIWIIGALIASIHYIKYNI